MNSTKNGKASESRMARVNIIDDKWSCGEAIEENYSEVVDVLRF